MKSGIKTFLMLGLVALALISCGNDQENGGGGTAPDPVFPEDDGDPDIGDLSAPGTFYDKFSTSLNTEVWEPMNRIWGQPDIAARQHGGVISANVSTNYGYAVLRALGDNYAGPLRGVNGFSKRLGAVITTKQRFGSGRFEVKMKVVQVSNMGVLSTAWLFWYKQITAAQYPEAYQKALDAGNVPDADGVITLNHEVDIEVKGIDLAGTIYTNWIGEKNGEYSSEGGDVAIKLNDNAYHVYRWDWHTGGNGETPRVEYYIDDQLMHTSTSYVPYIAANFNVGNWFAWWAGYDTGTYYPPAFDSKELQVDWVKITPFNEPNDDWME